MERVSERERMGEGREGRREGWVGKMEGGRRVEGRTEGGRKEGGRSW